MLVATSSTSENRAVRVKRRCGNRCTPILLEEVGVRFQPGELPAVEVEDFD